MKLTKLEHAGMIIEKTATKLVIDPGKFTTPVTEAAGAIGIVVTHQHDDHWTPEQLSRIAERNAGLTIFAPTDVAPTIEASGIAGEPRIVVAQPGDEHALGPFALRFFGGVHAEIHSSIPRVDNVGVVVNDEFAYGGDAYDAPLDADGELLAVGTLAVPAYGPWMRIADSIDYIDRVRPERVLGVHEMLLSKAGKELAATRLRAAVEAYGGTFLDLQPYDSVDISG